MNRLNLVGNVGVTLPAALPLVSALAIKAMLDRAPENCLEPTNFSLNAKGENDEAELTGSIEGPLGAICRIFADCTISEPANCHIEGSWTPSDYPQLLSNIQELARPHDGLNVSVESAGMQEFDSNLEFEINLEGPFSGIIAVLAQLANRQNEQLRAITVEEQFASRPNLAPILIEAGIRTIGDAAALPLDQLIEKVAGLGKTLQSQMLLGIAAMDIACQGATIKDMVDRANALTESMTLREQLAGTPDGAKTLEQFQKLQTLLDTPVSELKGDVLVNISVIQVPQGLQMAMSRAMQMMEGMGMGMVRRGYPGGMLMSGMGMTDDERPCPIHGHNCPSRNGGMLSLSGPFGHSGF